MTLRRASTARAYQGTTIDLSADGILVETDLEGAIGDWLMRAAFPPG